MPVIARHRGLPALWQILFVGALLSGQSGCSKDGFQCGVALDSPANTVTRCSRPHEVCVCETNSCALSVPAAECNSLLRYVDSPFARAELAGQCVVFQSSSEWVVKQGADPAVLPLCPVAPPTADMSIADAPVPSDQAPGGNPG